MRLPCLLGAVLAILGAIVGIIPFFRDRANIVLGAILGYYLGPILAIHFFGSPAHDDMIDVLQRGGPGVILVIITTVLCGILGARLPVARISLPAIGALVAGFVGGYLFGFVFRVASSTKTVGISPFVIGCALLTGVAIWFIQKRYLKPT